MAADGLQLSIIVLKPCLLLVAFWILLLRGENLSGCQPAPPILLKHTQCHRQCHQLGCALSTQLVYGSYTAVPVAVYEEPQLTHRPAACCSGSCWCSYPQAHNTQPDVSVGEYQVTRRFWYMSCL
jgi:hypothetical protein